MKYAVVAVDRKTGQASTLMVLDDAREAQKKVGSHNSWYGDEARHVCVPYEEKQ